MGCRAWVPSPCPVPGPSLLLLLLLVPLGAHPQAGRVSANPTARWPWAAGRGQALSVVEAGLQGRLACQAGLGNGSPGDPASQAPHPPVRGPLPSLRPLRSSLLFSPRPQSRHPGLEPKADGPCLGRARASPVQPLGLGRRGGRRPG